MSTTTAGASLRAPTPATARDLAAGARKASKKSPPPRFKSFSLVRKNGKRKPLNRELLQALNRALPGTAGQGDYWRDQVLNHDGEYPSLPTSTPPRECERYGDRGRIYAGYYVRSHASSLVQRGKRRAGFVCCLDCFNELWHRQRIDHAIWEGEIVVDGVAADYDHATAEAAPDTDGSASAAVLEALANQGVRLIESKLPPADDASLKELIARYSPDQVVKTINPFVT